MSSIWINTARVSPGALADAIRQLAARGEDLSAVVEAAKEVEDGQALKVAAKSAKRSPKAHRFVIAYRKNGDDAIKTAEGIEFADGQTFFDSTTSFPIPSLGSSLDAACRCAEKYGFQVYFEFID